MSLAKEMRDGLAYKPGATAAELAEICPSAKNPQRISSALSAFVKREEVIAQKDGGKLTYRLNADFAPTRKSPASPAKKARKTAAKKAAKKSTRKPARKPRAARPAPSDDTGGLLAARALNGDVIVVDQKAGTIDTLPAALVAQIAALHA